MKRDKKKQIFTATISLMLIFSMIIGLAVLMVGCSENDMRLAFTESRSKADVMYIGGQKRKISNDLYTAMFNGVKDLNKKKQGVDDKKYLAKEIYKAKQYGTYIHIAQGDGKFATYIKTDDMTALWGEIPDRTNATGKITKGESSYYNITSELKEEVSKAEKEAAKASPDEVVPR